MRTYSIILQLKALVERKHTWVGDDYWQGCRLQQNPGRYSMLAAQAFSMLRDNSRRHDTLSYTASNAMRQTPARLVTPSREAKRRLRSPGLSRVRPRENSRSAGSPSATRQKSPAVAGTLSAVSPSISEQLRLRQ